MLIDVLEQDGCMVDVFAHEMEANATQTGLEATRARSSWAGSKSLWRQTKSCPSSLPRRKLGTLLQDLRSAQQSARIVAPGSLNQLAAHVGRNFLEDRGQPNILNLKFCNRKFEPETLSYSWTDLPSTQKSKAHLDHSLQLVDFLKELSRCDCDAVAMAGNYLRPEARLGLSSLRFKMIRLKKLRIKMPTSIELSVPDFCQVLEAPKPLYLPLWRTCWATRSSSWTARLQRSGGSATSQMSGIKP